MDLLSLYIAVSLGYLIARTPKFVRSVRSGRFAVPLLDAYHGDGTLKGWAKGGFVFGVLVTMPLTALAWPVFVGIHLHRSMTEQDDG